ncbi:MAG: hypothetical protein KGN84_09675, partial [Acidobacteriota bacterium]|nr:hypothetical protein [Acidobacteriota bacterium]
LSVVIRNVSGEAKSLKIPGWLHFYNIELNASMSAFGRELMKPDRRGAITEATLAPGALSETQIPVGSIFMMRRGDRYTAQVSCTLPDGATLRSNTIEFTA